MQPIVNTEFLVRCIELSVGRVLSIIGETTTAKCLS